MGKGIRSLMKNLILHNYCSKHKNIPLFTQSYYIDQMTYTFKKKTDTIEMNRRSHTRVVGG